MPYPRRCQRFLRSVVRKYPLFAARSNNDPFSHETERERREHQRHDDDPGGAAERIRERTGGQGPADIHQMVERREDGEV